MAVIRRNRSGWSVDKSIPISLIFAVLLAGGGWIYSMGQLNSRVDNAVAAFTLRMDIAEKSSAERFAFVSSQRKEQTDQNDKKFELIAAQMLEMQKSQNQLNIKATEMSSDVKALGQSLIDIKTSLQKTTR